MSAYNVRRRPYRALKTSRTRQDNRPRAVALIYDGERMPAPTVSASGKGKLAERIIELAREHNIPIRQDAALAELLSQLDVGQIIPPELYPVVAEVLAFVYRLEGRQVGSRRERQTTSARLKRE